jgi:hypothetical protein
MKRRAAVEPVIGQLKAEQKGDGDRANAVLAARGDNFALFLAPAEAPFAHPSPGALRPAERRPIFAKTAAQPSFTDD